MLNTSRIAAVLRQLAAVAAIVVAAVPEIPLPTAVRAALISVAGAVIAIEHYLAPAQPAAKADAKAAAVAEIVRNSNAVPPNTVTKL